MNVLLGIGVVIGVVLTYFILRGPIPFMDKGFRIYAASSPQAKEILATSILPTFGLHPRYRIDGDGVERALMSDNTTVINYTEEEPWAIMGRPGAGLAVVTRNPMQAANKAVELLRAAGFSATVLGELDPKVPPGTMVFVQTNALVSTVLVFRRHTFRMGPRPPRW